RRKQIGAIWRLDDDRIARARRQEIAALVPRIGIGQIDREAACIVGEDGRALRRWHEPFAWRPHTAADHRGERYGASFGIDDDARERALVLDRSTANERRLDSMAFAFERVDADRATVVGMRDDDARFALELEGADERNMAAGGRSEN